MVANNLDIDDRIRFVDRVDDAIVSNTHPPEVIASSQFLATSGARSLGERIDSGSDPLDAPDPAGIQYRFTDVQQWERQWRGC